MNLAPVTLEHGEKYGKLTVLRKRDNRYSVGCECGARMLVSARKLMRGTVKACLRCSDEPDAFVCSQSECREPACQVNGCQRPSPR